MPPAAAVLGGSHGPASSSASTTDRSTSATHWSPRGIRAIFGGTPQADLNRGPGSAQFRDRIDCAPEQIEQRLSEGRLGVEHPDN